MLILDFHFTIKTVQICHQLIMFEDVMMNEEEMKTEVETVSQGVASMTAKNTGVAGVAITTLAVIKED